MPDRKRQTQAHTALKQMSQRTRMCEQGATLSGWRRASTGSGSPHSKAVALAAASFAALRCNACATDPPSTLIRVHYRRIFLRRCAVATAVSSHGPELERLIQPASPHVIGLSFSLRNASPQAFEINRD